LLFPAERLYNIILDRHFARKRIERVAATQNAGVMGNKHLSTNTKLGISFVGIVALLIFSGFLANTVQNSTAQHAKATFSQNELNMLVLAIKGDIAESMLPAHDYLIEAKPSEAEEFRGFKKRIAKTFKKLSSARHFELSDRRIIREALGQFTKLIKIQEEIFSLHGEDIRKIGPEKMEHMHIYQHSILDKLGYLNKLEEAELADLSSIEQATSRRTLLLIVMAAAFALGGALLVGYLSSQT